MFPFQDHELPRSTSEISRARRTAAFEKVLEEKIRRIRAEDNRIAIRRESQARRLRREEDADILRQVRELEHPFGYVSKVTDRLKETGRAALDTTGRAVREVRNRALAARGEMKSRFDQFF